MHLYREKEEEKYLPSLKRLARAVVIDSRVKKVCILEYSCILILKFFVILLFPPLYFFKMIILLLIILLGVAIPKKPIGLGYALEEGTVFRKNEKRSHSSPRLENQASGTKLKPFPAKSLHTFNFRAAIEKVFKKKKFLSLIMTSYVFQRCLVAIYKSWHLSA